MANNRTEQLSVNKFHQFIPQTKQNSRTIAIYILSKVPLEQDAFDSNFGDMVLNDLHRLQEFDSTVITCLSRDALRRYINSDYKYFYVVTIEKVFSK